MFNQFVFAAHPIKLYKNSHTKTSLISVREIASRLQSAADLQ